MKELVLTNKYAGLLFHKVIIEFTSGQIDISNRPIKYFFITRESLNNHRNFASFKKNFKEIFHPVLTPHSPPPTITCYKTGCCARFSRAKREKPPSGMAVFQTHSNPGFFGYRVHATASAASEFQCETVKSEDRAAESRNDNQLDS